MFSMIELYAWILGTYPLGNQGDRFLVLPYYYPTTFEDLTHGSSAINIINIAANADFVIRSMNYRACKDNGDATDTNGDVVPKVEVQITDVGSSLQYASSQVDIATFMGQVDHAQFAAPWPRKVAGRSQLSVSVNSYAGTDDYSRLTITFWGMLVQSMGPMRDGDVPVFSDGVMNMNQTQFMHGNIQVA